MNTKDVGDISESRIIYEAKSLGLTVLETFGDNERYDFVFDDGESFTRVQVKTASMRDGCLHFATSSISQRVDNKQTDYTEKEIDGFAIWSSETGKAYWVNVNNAASGNMSLRVEEPERDHPNINYHRDYLFSEAFKQIETKVIDVMTEYPNEEVREFMESDHRLAGALPVHQPDDDADDPHRLDGAVPAQIKRV